MKNRIVLSNSRRWMGTGCKRRFYLQYIEGLRPKRKKSYFKFGSYWHLFQETLFRAEMLGEKVDYASVVSEMRDYILKNEPTELPEEMEETMEMTALIVGMMKRYEPEYRSIISNYDILGVEVPYRLKFAWNRRGVGEIHPKLSIKLLDLKSEERPKNELVGVVDLIVREKNDNGVFFMEHKTTGEDVQLYESKINHSYQRYGYSIAVRKLTEKHKWGKFIGVIYNVAEKKIPKYPTMNQCHKCKGTKVIQKGKKEGMRCELCDGTGYGKISLRSNLQTTAENIREVYNRYPHLKKPEFKKWREKKFFPYLEKKKGTFPITFKRFDTYVGKTEFEAFGIDTMNVFREVRSRLGMKEEEAIRDFSFMGCRTCPVKDLCVNDSESLRQVEYKVVENQEWPYEFGEYVKNDNDNSVKNSQSETELSIKAKSEAVQKFVDDTLGF